MLSVSKSDSNAMSVSIFLTNVAAILYADLLSYVYKINIKISSNVIILTIFKTNDLSKS